MLTTQSNKFFWEGCVIQDAEVLQIPIQAKDELKVKRTTITCHKINVPLWGTIQGKYFTHEQLILTLCKDMYVVGYNRLWGKTKLWVGIAASSLRHNIKVIRLAAAGWARKQIKLGVSPDWNAATRGAKLAKEVRGTNLSGWTPLI